MLGLSVTPGAGEPGDQNCVARGRLGVWALFMSTLLIKIWGRGMGKVLEICTSFSSTVIYTGLYWHWKDNYLGCQAGLELLVVGFEGDGPDWRPRGGISRCSCSRYLGLGPLNVMRGDRTLKQRNLDHRKVFKGHASQRLPTAQSFRSCRQWGCLSLPCVQTRLIGEASCFDSGDVHIQMNSIPKECAGNPSSRNIRSGVQSCTQERVHSRYRVTSTMKQGSLMILTRNLEIMVVAPSQNSNISSRGCKKVFYLFWFWVLNLLYSIQQELLLELGYLQLLYMQPKAF